MDLICQLSDGLRTGLNREALTAVVELIEGGANPDAVAAAIAEVRREVVGGGGFGGGGGGC